MLTKNIQNNIHPNISNFPGNVTRNKDDLSHPLYTYSLIAFIPFYSRNKCFMILFSVLHALMQITELFEVVLN